MHTNLYVCGCIVESKSYADRCKYRITCSLLLPTQTKQQNAKKEKNWRRKKMIINHSYSQCTSFSLNIGVFVCWRNEKVVRLQPHIVCCVPLPLVHHRCAPNRSSILPLFWLFDLSGSVAYICLCMQPNTMSKHTSSSSSSSWSSRKLSALVWLYSTMCHLNVRIVKITMAQWTARQNRQFYNWIMNIADVCNASKDIKKGEHDIWNSFEYCFRLNDYCIIDCSNPFANTNTKLMCQSIGNYWFSIATYQFDWVGRKFINFIHKFLACNSIRLENHCKIRFNAKNDISEWWQCSKVNRIFRNKWEKLKKNENFVTFTKNGSIFG